MTPRLAALDYVLPRSGSILKVGIWSKQASGRGRRGRQMNPRRRDRAISRLLAEPRWRAARGRSSVPALVNAEPGSARVARRSCRGLETTADQMFVDLNSQVPDTFIRRWIGRTSIDWSRISMR